ncbi:MAG: chlorohydrolase, partial [Candidatus Cloacimonetes bacterium]|nr:chlorohydrolase [Candidatus Cloacimonadota bacterium]
MNIEIKNGYIIIPQQNKISVQKGDIFIHNGNIEYRKNFKQPNKIINVKNRVIFPGLVNAHHHIYSCLSKGIHAKTPFQNFEGILKNLWWKLDRALLEDDVKLSAVLTLQDCIRNGVTTIFD